MTGSFQKHTGRPEPHLSDPTGDGACPIVRIDHAHRKLSFASREHAAAAPAHLSHYHMETATFANIIFA
jgi:hypothetical protein